MWQVTNASDGVAVGLRFHCRAVVLYISWELVRNKESRKLPQTYWIRIFLLNRSPRWFVCTLEFMKHEGGVGVDQFSSLLLWCWCRTEPWSWKVILLSSLPAQLFTNPDVVFRRPMHASLSASLWLRHQRKNLRSL